MYSYRVHVEVYPLRRNGFKIPDRDQRTGQPMRGHLAIGNHWITQTKTKLAATIRREPGCTSPDAVLGVLFDPVVKSLEGHVLLISGWELIDWKGDGRQAVVQEWVCSLVFGL